MRSEEAGVHLVTASVGFLAFFLLWLAVVWGLVLRNGWMATRFRHQTIYGTHQVLVLFGLLLAVVHGFAQLAMPGTFLRLIDVLVPFTYWRDPIGVGVGVLALELIVAIALSILVQRWLGYTRWRMLHRMSYPAFTLATAHILISGTDPGAVYLTAAVLFAWLLSATLWFLTLPRVVDAWHRIRGQVATGRGGREIAINVDPTRCARFGFCEHEAPSVFVLRGNGLLSHRATVPAEEFPAVSRAAEVCPTRAIAIAPPLERLP